MLHDNPKDIIQQENEGIRLIIYDKAANTPCDVPLYCSFVLLLRTAFVAKWTEPVAIILVTVASIVLAGRVRGIQDIGGLSQDALHLAAYLIVTFCERCRSGTYPKAMTC